MIGLKTLLLIALSFGTGSAQAQQKAERTGLDYVQEVSDLLREADRADASEQVMARARARASELAMQYAGKLKSHKPVGAEKFYLGYLYYLVGDGENALAAFKDVLSDTNLSIEDKQRSRLYVIELLAAAGKLKDAETELAAIPDAAFNAREVLSSGHTMLSMAYTKTGQLPKALEHGEQAFQNARKSGVIPLISKDAWTLGQLYVALDRKDDAAATLAVVKSDFERQSNFATGESYDALKRAIAQIKNAMAQLELVGKPAPPIVTVKSLAETTASLSDLKGKVVALEFWAAWCPDCRAMAPHVRDWATRYQKEGFKVLAVTRYYGFNGREVGKASKEEEERMLLNFKQGRGLPYGALLDDGEKSFETYNVATIPTIAVIDRTGRVRFMFTWHDNPGLCEAIIKKVLAEPAVARN